MASSEASSGGGFAATKRIFDLATVSGLISAIVLVVLAIAQGGSASIFINFPSMLIVLGGTFGVIVASFSFKDLWQSFKLAGHAFLRRSHPYQDIGGQLIQVAQVSRSKGVLYLQNYLHAFKESPLMHRGVVMLIDGIAGEEVENIMMREVHLAQALKTRSTNILRKAAEVSPAMGLIGTLIGLVQMLGQLDDPDSIGPAMAVALITTFYGALLATLVFSPLANKLERVASEELITNQLYVIAVGSMARHENPRRLEMLMNTILPPQNQVKFFGD